MNAKEQRGVLLAATARIVEKNGLWVVPSQTKASTSYLVNLEHGTCTCPSYGEFRKKCKHLYAAEFVAKRETGKAVKFPDHAVPLSKKRVSGKQNWPIYNRAQQIEKRRFQVLLHELCRDLPTPKNPVGRPRVPMPNLIFASVFKVYTRLSNRRFMSDLADAIEKGYVSKYRHYNAIGAYLNFEPVEEVLTGLIEQSSLPLREVETDFAVDSTGFASNRFVRWYDNRHDVERSGHDWVKVHIMAGVKTNIVTSVEIRERTAHDAPLFGPLVRSTARNFSIREISADKAYISEENIDLSCEVGATPYIAFKDNAVPERGGLWEKSLRYF